MVAGVYIGLQKILECQNLSKKILGQYEQKLHKPWFDDECSKLSDQKKQVKLQWLQDPSQINADNLITFKI